MISYRFDQATRAGLVTCLILAFGGLVNMARTASAAPVSTDLWDISQGTVVDTTTGVLYYSYGYRSDIHNMFGGALGTVGVPHTLFKDYMSPGYQGGSVPAGYVHAVEWHTPSAVTLRSFSLFAYNEGMTRRAFNRFTLFSSNGSGDPWTQIFDTGSGFTYGPGQLDLSVNVTPTVAQFFRAEFVQAPWTDSAAIGPRIQELDGFDTFLPGLPTPVPEPTTLAIWGLLGACGAAMSARPRKLT